MYRMIKNSFIFQTLNICTIFYITDVFVTFLITERLKCCCLLSS